MQEGALVEGVDKPGAATCFNIGHAQGRGTMIRAADAHNTKDHEHVPASETKPVDDEQCGVLDNMSSAAAL